MKIGHRLVLHAEGPTGRDVTRIELDGMPLHCRRLELVVGVDEIAEATLTVHIEHFDVAVQALTAVTTEPM